ncbi:MAG: SpoIIE family protein phosphatase [Agathobacter sp.]|nr:SpoIIE family protein phosphatase [Agathobacter sp.]MBQ6812368.1 SpoIIE family protein phosphatase [Agathobacter sp.]
MNNLCIDIGYKSINHYGEELCGDHIEIVEQDENSSVIVLADGLGSGVKASILSTLTSKIISTMMAAGLPIDECVSTIAATLPVCSQRGVAYSTFTIMHLIDNERIEIIQYDNPHVIMIRDGQNYEYSMTEIVLDGKKIYKTNIHLQEGDVFVAMSDGCPYAGAEATLNYNWKREDIIAFMEVMVMNGLTAKNLATMLVDECNKLYAEKPGDDTTACVVKVRNRVPVNLLFGPPEDPDDENRMMALFFAKEGKHVVCGGTTSKVVARYLDKEIEPLMNTEQTDIPPISKIEGVDLVTEGVVTINRVVEYAKDHVAENEQFENWYFKKNGAALISKILFDEATDINFFVGKAINPAHQNPNLPINFNLKMSLVEDLTKALRDMGKRVKVSYF